MSFDAAQLAIFEKNMTTLGQKRNGAYGTMNLLTLSVSRWVLFFCSTLTLEQLSGQLL
jgi:hypothetical protein